MWSIFIVPVGANIQCLHPKNAKGLCSDFKVEER